MRRFLSCVAMLFSAGCNCGDRGGVDAGTGPFDGGVVSQADGGPQDGGLVSSPDAGATDGGTVVTDGGALGLDGGTLGLDGGSGCEGLTAAACTATPGCRADFCSGCTCAAGAYMGCHTKASHPPICPLSPCPTPTCCGKDSDCGTNSFCASPESPPRCAVCNAEPSSCTTDSQCAPSICDPRACACNAETACTPGCSEANPCFTGTVCNAGTRRCETIACTGDTQCPSTFKCDIKVCVRRTCVDDTGCGTGVCVNGACFDTKGQCEFPIR